MCLLAVTSHGQLSLLFSCVYNQPGHQHTCCFHNPHQPTCAYKGSATSGLAAPLRLTRVRLSELGSSQHCAMLCRISFGNNDVGDVDAGYASIHPDEILQEIVSAVQPAALPVSFS